MLAASGLNVMRLQLLPTLRSCALPSSTTRLLSSTTASKCCRPAGLSSGRKVGVLLPNSRGVLLFTVRHGGGHGPPVIPMKAGRYEWDKFKDYLIYYFCLGLVPVGLIVTYINVFVGSAELAEIPEGYQPQDYEYEKHPITRFLAKNVFVSPQRNYEKLMHYWWEESEKQRFRLLRRKVNEAMALEEDYKSWYYIPADSSAVSRSREATEHYYDNASQQLTGDSNK